MYWYYTEGTHQFGPVDEVGLQELVRGGTVRAETLIWREGLADWLPYQVLHQGNGSGLPLYPCASCQRGLPLLALVPLAGVWVCAWCKPLALQRLQEGVWLRGAVRYGGFWIRVAARVIDSTICGVAGFALSMFAVPFIVLFNNPGAILAAQGALFVLQTILYMWYEGWFLSRKGATPGKMAVSLRVTRPDGGPITFWRGAGRYMAHYLDSMVLGIGYLMAAFDDEKRALHDHVCDTRVVVSQTP